MTNVAVIYYSATGNVHALAEAVAQGAAGAGANVRLRRVAELAPVKAIEANPAWCKHFRATRSVDVATLDDVCWADAIAFGSPMRFGTVSAQLEDFLESTGPLWLAGELADKVVTGFTSSGKRLALDDALQYWGAVFVAPAYRDGVIAERDAARCHGARLARIAAALAGERGREPLLAA